MAAKQLEPERASAMCKLSARQGGGASMAMATSAPRAAFVLIDRSHQQRPSAPAWWSFSHGRQAGLEHRPGRQIDRSTRPPAPRAFGQKPCGCLWFTGLSGSGKSTVVRPGSSRSCTTCGQRTYLLDGDNVRHGLNKRSRLHRPGRPGREHPPGRRGRQADGRCRADRPDLVHLAVPLRAPAWRAT